MNPTNQNLHRQQQTTAQLSLFHVETAEPQATPPGSPTLHTADCLEWMQQQPDNSVDLVFGSPPYENARTYGINFKLAGDDWVQWMLERTTEALRICRGLVAWVVEGRTCKYRYTATPILLMAELHRAGVHLRKPPIYAKSSGMPGSGGRDWLRNDYEFIVCCTSGGRLPWSNNIACGEPVKHERGGDFSNRKVNGERSTGSYPTVKIANPGNIVKCNVGGGHLGHPLAHQNEAPFPLPLPEFFVKSFCPPGGVVLDPFCGSGSTGHAAIINGRNFVGIDVRENQIELTQQRLAEVSQ